MEQSIYVVLEIILLLKGLNKQRIPCIVQNSTCCRTCLHKLTIDNAKMANYTTQLTSVIIIKLLLLYLEGETYICALSFMYDFIIT